MRVPMKMPGGATQLEAHPVLYPHQLAWALEHYYPEVFCELTGSDVAPAWWSRQPEDNPKFHGHPVLLREDWKSRALPIEVFGDGAKFTDVSGLYCLSWSFKLARGRTLETKFIFTMIPKEPRPDSAICSEWRTLFSNGRTSRFSRDLLFDLGALRGRSGPSGVRSGPPARPQTDPGGPRTTPEGPEIKKPVP